jgi:hypothetical protein
VSPTSKKRIVLILRLRLLASSDPADLAPVMERTGFRTIYELVQPCEIPIFAACDALLFTWGELMDAKKMG